MGLDPLEAAAAEGPDLAEADLGVSYLRVFRKQPQQPQTHHHEHRAREHQKGPRAGRRGPDGGHREHHPEEGRQQQPEKKMDHSPRHHAQCPDGEADEPEDVI